MIGRYNYRYALNSFIRSDERTHGVAVVIPTNHREFPVSTPGRYESLRMKFVRHGIHQVCPGVVNSLGTPRSRKSGATVGKKSKMPHEMLLRDSESTVHKIKILM